MTEELNELREAVLKGIEERGFAFFRDFNDGNVKVYHKDGRAYYEYEEERINIFSGKKYRPEHLNGRTLEVEETYRNNGTSRNHSIYIRVVDWKSSSGHTVFRTKINEKFSAKKIARLIDEAVAAYEA